MNINFDKASNPRSFKEVGTGMPFVLAGNQAVYMKCHEIGQGRNNAVNLKTGDHRRVSAADNVDIPRNSKLVLEM